MSNSQAYQIMRLACSFGWSLSVSWHLERFSISENPHSGDSLRLFLQNDRIYRMINLLVTWKDFRAAAKSRIFKKSVSLVSPSYQREKHVEPR